jgi:hypothetical protein
MRSRLLVAAGAVVLLTSCTGSHSSSGPETTTPRATATLEPAPGVHINVSDRDATRDGGMVMQAGLAGTLRVNQQGCLYGYVPKSPGTGGREFRTDLVWPRGTTVALNDEGTPVVVRYDGVIVAEVGHSLRGLGGGTVHVQNPADVTCLVHAAANRAFYVEGDMPPISDGS